ncbi:MAG: NADP-dependent phosphogluconate dehydrogenase [Anaerolineaceae bacterium]|nr:NADP-dependent phosphogluconate dehydrogenase [Anaerolineaceae bacterium]
MKYKFGVVGLGVMGHNLALNIERNGFSVVGYDLDAAKMNAFLAGPAAGKAIIGVDSPQKLMDALEKPRRILLMVPAGSPVDSAIEHLKPYLEPGDILIDGGNSFFQDTDRRSEKLNNEGFNFFGCGVSGGEVGALWGPSLMPGGPQGSWLAVKDIFEAISAKVDGEPCVTYIGPRGSGHFVKMVHNGIEYGDMQLIAETYDLLHCGLGLSNAELHQVFSDWNRGKLESYLIEITADIFTKQDAESGKAIVDLILDEAQQKGTGKWTSQNSLDLGAPIPTINASVESRILSAYKAERVKAARVLQGPKSQLSASAELIDTLRDALYAAKICSYAQGFAMLRLASKEYEYQLNYSEIARIWRGGCIIRARFLNDISAAFKRSPDLANLMMDPQFAGIMNSHQAALRKVVALAAENGIPVLALGSALAYYDAYRSERLPANLTQAQRDYFGAHTYRRTDREGSFHTEWTD